VKKPLIIGLGLALIWVAWAATGYGIYIGKRTGISEKYGMIGGKNIYCRYLTAIGIDEVVLGYLSRGKTMEEYEYNCPRRLF